MNSTPISIITAQYLMRLAKDELEFGDKVTAAKQAVEELKRYLETLDRPDFYTLRSEGGNWRIGAGDGLPHSPSSTEILGGLAVLELAVTYPGDPVRIEAFLQPGYAYKKLQESAKKAVTKARQWIADECDVNLADLLKAVSVTTDDLGHPVAVCGTLPAPIITAYTTP